MALSRRHWSGHELVKTGQLGSARNWTAMRVIQWCQDRLLLDAIRVRKRLHAVISISKSPILGWWQNAMLCGLEVLI